MSEAQNRSQEPKSYGSGNAELPSCFSWVCWLRECLNLPFLIWSLLQGFIYLKVHLERRIRMTLEEQLSMLGITLIMIKRNFCFVLMLDVLCLYANLREIYRDWLNS